MTLGSELSQLALQLYSSRCLLLMMNLSCRGSTLEPKPHGVERLRVSLYNSISKCQVRPPSAVRQANMADNNLAQTPNPWDTGERAGKYQASEDDSLGISVEVALGVLQHDKKHAMEMRQIILAITSFGIFAAAIFLHIPTATMYHQHYGVFSALATVGGDSITDESPVKYYNIETIPDIFDWLNDTFVTQAFVTADYNGAALPETQWGRIATFNKVLGGVHFEVTYMESGECDTSEFIGGIYSTCYDSSRTTTDKLLISFDTNISDATTLLTEKKYSGKWLNSSTQQLVITVITLNGQLSGAAVTKLQLDFNDGGYVEPSASTTSTLLDQYPSTTTIVLDVVVVMWFLSWILFSASWLHRIISYGITLFREYRAVKYTASMAGIYKDYCEMGSRPWRAVTMNSDFRRKLISLGEGGLTDGGMSDTLKSVTHSFRLIASLTVLLRLFAAGEIFVLGLRILYTCRTHVSLGVLTRTMVTALRYVWAFSLVCTVVFVAFAIAGAVLFGDRVQDFSSFLSAMKTCINMTYGNFDFDSIKDIDYSVVYYWAYMAIETFVVLNIVLAIVVDAYQEEKPKKDEDQRWTFLRVADNVSREWLSRVNDLLWIPCCRHENSRHYVVFWGRIRPAILDARLRAVLDARLLAAPRCGDPSVDWTDKTLITAITLKELFPVDTCTTEECEVTLTHIAAGKQQQSCHELVEKTADKDEPIALPLKLENIRSVQSPGGGIQENFSYSPAQKSSRRLSANGVGRPDVDNLIICMDTLQQKLDLLIEQPNIDVRCYSK